MKLTNRQLQRIIKKALQESFHGPSDAMIRLREEEPDPSDLLKGKPSSSKSFTGYQTPDSDEDKLEEITDLILDYFGRQYESEDFYAVMEELAQPILDICKK